MGLYCDTEIRMRWEGGRSEVERKELSRDSIFSRERCRFYGRNYNCAVISAILTIISMDDYSVEFESKYEKFTFYKRMESIYKKAEKGIIKLDILLDNDK